MTALRSLLSLCLGWLIPFSAQAADWPQWRGNAGHTAATDAELPEKLHLQWVREYSPR